MKRNVAAVESSAGKGSLARLLPIVLVRQKICYMPCGGTGTFTFGRIKYKIRTSCEKNGICVRYVGTLHWEGADCKVTLMCG